MDISVSGEDDAKLVGFAISEQEVHNTPGPLVMIKYTRLIDFYHLGAGNGDNSLLVSKAATDSHPRVNIVLKLTCESCERLCWF